MSSTVQEFPIIDKMAMEPYVFMAEIPLGDHLNGLVQDIANTCVVSYQPVNFFIDHFLCFHSNIC